MRFDSDRHRRRSIRLPDYDYSSAGAYFVTVCTHQRQCLFGEVEGIDMHLNDLGRMIVWHWQRIPKHFHKVQLDEFTVMPNHLHGLLLIVDKDEMDDTAGAKHLSQDSGSSSQLIPQNASPLQGSGRARLRSRPAGTPPQSLSAVLQNFKSITARKFNGMRRETGGILWQRNYFERVIRDENEFDRIRKYIIDNPAKWAEDKENPANM